jgi:peptidyl-prolyl cis-trans isomerase SurA
VRSNFLIRMLCALALLSSMNLYLKAQEEGEQTVVDEVIAQVNNDVVTLSMLKREMKDAIEALKQQKGMTEQQATDEISRRKPELIATLINEQLLIQKAKDLNLTDDAETEVNRRMLAIAEQENIKTIEELEKAMIASKLDPAAIRQSMRTEILKGMVLNREVDAKIYHSLTPDEIKKYFDANKDKFKVPESVVLSEIFLSVNGKVETDVLAKAKAIAERARKGEDFVALVNENSERVKGGSAERNGKLGRIPVEEIKKSEYAEALKVLKPGTITDPLRTKNGYVVLRVDEYIPANAPPKFTENEVREAMAMERASKERSTYLEELREEAYLKIAADYKSTVEPLLKKKTATTAKPNTSPTAPASASKTNNKQNEKRP